MWRVREVQTTFSSDNSQSSPPMDASIWANLSLDFQLKLLDHLPLRALFRAKMWRQAVLSLWETKFYYVHGNKIASPGENCWSPLPLDYLPNYPEELPRADVWPAASMGLLLVETRQALIVTNPLTRRWTRLPRLLCDPGSYTCIISFQAFPDSSFRVVCASSECLHVYTTLQLLVYHHRCGAAVAAPWEGREVDIGDGQVLASNPELGLCSDGSNVFFVTWTRLASATEEFSLKSINFVGRGSVARTVARWKSLPPGFMVLDKFVYLPVVCGGRILLPCMQTSSGGDRVMVTPALLLLDERLEQWQPFVAMPLDDLGLVPRELVPRMASEWCIRARACEEEVVLSLLGLEFQCVYRISSRTWSPLPLEGGSICIGTIPFKFSLLGTVPGFVRSVPFLLVRNHFVSLCRCLAEAKICCSLANYDRLAL
ncbi:uncharacterized protein LOC9643469 isoform X1 [Selaginella moellendorffii]|uniref:uncharacterized protein LOC9643469 isoform X1 n=1 Tax=Selaginella moellendorffii TaxID=88036 RepID=UPI000D1C3D00|nr:uncharacterized protein LOC9643469 isoform X1 [Selaginella moellendorffii]|eukprot:XP_024524213.1 uncharacterized protein LOC9643469 isoform X1 [Selaginella moellendorffii]